VVPEQFAFGAVWFTPVPLRVTALTAVAEFVVKDSLPEYAVRLVGVKVTL
jgi:hypothetical protein